MHKQEESAYAASIGIDWADKKHDICLQVSGVEKRERLVLEHRPRAIQAWAEQLRERFSGAPVAVSVELSRGPIVSALLEHDFFVLFPVQPTTVANYRKAFSPSVAFAPQLSSCPRKTGFGSAENACYVPDMRTFTAVVERDPDTGLFVGYIPGWPGAHSQGATEDELRGNLKQVIAMLLEDGEPVLQSEFVGTQTVRVA